MTINVYRLYETNPGESSDDFDPQNYMVSLITTENEARYVYPTDSQLELGDRIEVMAEAAKRDGTLPTTPEEWADLALYNMGLGVKKVLVLEIPEDSNVELIEVADSETLALDEIVIPEMRKARGL